MNKKIASGIISLAALAASTRGVYDITEVGKIYGANPEIGELYTLREKADELKGYKILDEAKERVNLRINELEAIPGLLENEKEWEDATHRALSFLAGGILLTAFGVATWKSSPRIQV
ncbi:MAG: hypothetical protein AABW73_04845 [Nanoarchaeota archaeon]